MSKRILSNMVLRLKKSQNYVPGAAPDMKLIGSGGGMKIVFAPSGGGGGGGGSGTATDPYVLLTDGTPLLFTIDSSVSAEYRANDAEDTYFGRYATFMCPALSPGEMLRIRYGIQTDGVDYLDTYMTVFEGSTFTLGVNTLINYDDDGGDGYYDTFENTKLEFGNGNLTEGDSYIIEATTYGNSDTGNVKMIADVVTAPPVPTTVYINSTLINSTGDVITASSEAVFPLYMYTTGLDATYSIVNSLSEPVDSGNMPVDLRSLTDGDTYTVTAGGTATFTLIMTALPSISGVANKVLHLDAADPATLTLSTYDVTAWADKSAAGNNATSILEPSGFYPVYSPLNIAVEFNSLNLTGMSTNAFAGAAFSAAKTIFFVGSNIEANADYVGNGSNRVFWALGSGNGMQFVRYGVPGAVASYNFGSGGSIWYNVNIPTRAEPPYLFAYRNTPGTNPQTVRMYNATTFEDVNNSTLPTYTSTYGVHLMRPLPGATVGYPGGGSYTSGNVHEVLAYNTDLSDGDVSTIIQYIKLKWAIIA